MIGSNTDLSFNMSKFIKFQLNLDIWFHGWQLDDLNKTLQGFFRVLKKTCYFRDANDVTGYFDK